MSNFGLNKQVDPDVAVSELPGGIYLKLRDILNTNPPDKDWRALIRCVEDRYTIKPVYIEQWSVNTNGQAAGNLLTELSAQGMNVGELADYLKKINIDTHSLGLAPYESVIITTEPDEFLEAYEGGSVQIILHATGNPFPRYQWFFCKDGTDDFVPLTGRIENKLPLDNLTAEDAGTYACQLHNCQDPKETKISKHCLVSVKPDPAPKFSGLHPPSSEHINNIIGDRKCAICCKTFDKAGPWLLSSISAGPLSPLKGITDLNLTDPDFLTAQKIYSCKGSTPQNLIIRQPQDLRVGMNEQFCISVETNGNPPIVYQWFKGDFPLQQYSPKLEMTIHSRDDYGQYHCVVRNGLVVERSRAAQITAKRNINIPNVFSCKLVDEGESKCDKQLEARRGCNTSGSACRRNPGIYERVLFPLGIPEIEIVSQPKSLKVSFGVSAIFSCEARCSEPLKYQWFKDGILLPDKTSPEIKFMNIQDICVKGRYQCEISINLPDREKFRKMTVDAFLDVEIPKVFDNIQYNPSDKVALLIGNSDYRSEQNLSAPRYDVQVLQELFRKLNFKVVSLLNLTKTEIENAVMEFCNLVDRNVYCVFYFAGHGFEEDGLSYLVPTDAPAGYKCEECVCADMVLDHIQKKTPPLILMILDICRKKNRVVSPPRCALPPSLERKADRGNTVFCYATSVGLNAFEHKNQICNGLLVTHLQKLLTKNVGIDALISELKEEFNSNEKHRKNHIQIPELRSNLVEPRRSLADKISTKGQTQIFQERTMRWKNALEKPATQTIRFKDIGVEVQLSFQSDFSNILHVYTRVLEQGVTQKCVAWANNTNPSISIDDGRLVVNNPVTTKVTLLDIQKLQSPLCMDVFIDCMVGGKQLCLKTRRDFGFPLVSKMKLWRPSENFLPPRREPMEQMEDSSSFESSGLY